MFLENFVSDAPGLLAHQRRLLAQVDIPERHGDQRPIAHPCQDREGEQRAVAALHDIGIGAASIAARICSRLGKSRSFADLAAVASLIAGLRYSMSGTWILDLKPRCHASQMKNSLSIASVLTCVEWLRVSPVFRRLVSARCSLKPMACSRQKSAEVAMASVFFVTGERLAGLV